MVAMRLLRVLRGERVDLPDFAHGTATSQRDIAAQQNDRVTIGPDKTGSSAPTPKAFVISGFAVSVDGAGTITITGGDAVLGFKDRGVTKYGQLIAEGTASQTTSISGFDDATAPPYGVWIRAGFTETDVQNRPFWNPFGSPNPTEFPRSVATRETADWQFAVELVAPGEEWIQIATVSKNAGVYDAIDTRDFFFEGKLANSYRVVDSEWGASTPPDDNDRSSTRPTFGVFGLYRFVRGVQRQIQDIIGGVAPNWWLNPQAGTSSGVGPRSLNQLNDEKLARNGAQTMTGDLLPNASETLNIGSALVHWRDIWVRKISIAETVLTSLVPDLDDTMDLGSALKRWSELYLAAWETQDSILDELKHVGGSSPVIRFNNTAPALENRGFILAFRDGAPTGTDVKITVCAGDAASQGTGQVQLLGTDNQLAKNCMGQNGIAYCDFTFTILVGSVPALGRVTFTAALTGHTGGNITTSDAVIGIIPSDIIRELVLSNPPYISGVNTIAFEIVNPDNALAKPLLNDTVTGKAVILRT